MLVLWPSITTTSELVLSELISGGTENIKTYKGLWHGVVVNTLAATLENPGLIMTWIWNVHFPFIIIRNCRTSLITALIYLLNY
jgi:hypothetical protein